LRPARRFSALRGSNLAISDASGASRRQRLASPVTGRCDLGVTMSHARPPASRRIAQNTVSQSHDPALGFGIALQWRHQYANAPHALGLLRTHRERPSYRSAAEQSGELPPSKVEHGASSRASCQGR
jgi:hypothetical protein